MIEAREDGEWERRGFPKGSYTRKKGSDFRGGKEKPLGG